MEKQRHLMTIFDEALDIAPGAERQAFLDAACAGQPELRQKVDAFLGAYEEAGSFLEPPASCDVSTVNAPDAPILEGPGSVIGPYKLLEQIGAGGFGVVFMAEQKEPIRRKVALKVLKAGMDSKEVIARFEAERQALALMEHVNIAKVLDAGQTTSGRPFFVMELVKGVPITKFCDQSQLTLKERLELFVDVCRAVQHAHQKGIIHRDIKPSNVLVTLQDGTPLVKVIDFGIAKALGQQLTDKTLFTGFAQMIGTPLYMSPEQAALSNIDVDTRCDIYSLGVLLYELMTGTTPFDRKRFHQAAYDEIRRIIREEEPPKPSTRISTLGEAAQSASAQRKTNPKRLSQVFRGDLDWIVMKALDKDRNRRFETANGFAEDIQRYLADEPVLAGPPTTGYRLRKFVRRHRAGVLVAAAATAVLGFALGGIGWVLGDRAARAAEVSRQVHGSIDAVRSYVARDQLPEARQKLAEAKAQLANDSGTLGHLAAQVDRMEYELNRFQQFQELIDRAHQGEAAPMLDAAPLGQPNHGGAPAPATPRTRERYAAAAVPFLLKALQSYDVLEGGDWKATIKGGLLKEDKVEELGRRAYEELLWLADDVVRRQIDHRSRQSLKPEAAARAALVYLGKAENAHKPTQALYGLRARCHEALGDTAAAQADKKLAAKTPPTIAADHYLRGLAAFNARQRAEGIAAFEAALRLEPTHYWSMMNLGYCLAELGQTKDDLLGAAWVFTGCILKRPEHEYGYYARAIIYFRLGRYEDAIADCTKAIAVEPKMAGAWVFRGAACAKLGKKAQALFNCTKAIQINPKYPLAWFHRGLVCADLGQWDKAQADYARAFKLDRMFGEAWNNLCEIYFRLEQWDKAVEDFTQWLEWDPQFSPALVNRGLAYAKLGKSDEALADFSKVTATHPEWDVGWINRANVYAQMKDWDKALAEHSKAVAIWSKAIALNPQDPERHNNVAWQLATHAEPRFRDPRRAVELAKKAVELAPKAENYWNTLGAAHYRAGACEDARAALEQSMKLSNGGSGFDWFFLAMAHWQLGHKDEAYKLYERAVQWMGANQPQNDELRRFRTEAAELLGIQERGKDPK